MAIKVAGLTRITDKEKVFSTLLDAFEEYPKLSKAFPEKDRRLIAIEATVRYYASYDMRYGRAYSLDSSCKEVVLLVNSRRMRYTKLKHILAGSYSSRYKRVISKLTDEERIRRVEIFEEMNEMEKELKFPKHHIYIDFLGVKNQYQRQGRGRMIMEEVISYSEEVDLPLMLFTNTTEDVRFYQSLGFRAVGITSSKKFKFINTYLVREVSSGKR